MGNHRESKSYSPIFIGDDRMKIYRIYRNTKEYFDVRGEKCTETTDGEVNIYRDNKIVFKIYTKNVMGIEILEKDD